MKKLLILMLVALSAQAGMWSMVSGMAMKEIKPQAAYTVDTNGINPRIYEFDTKVEPIMHCVIMVASSEGMAAPAMQCFKK